MKLSSCKKESLLVIFTKSNPKYTSPHKREMGKQKKTSSSQQPAQRRPKDVKGPSSSRNAAESLVKREAELSAFSRFKLGASSEEIVSGSFEGISDPTFRTHFKHLGKKDPTTRVKALQIIQEQITSRPDYEVIAILPEWVATLKKLVQDNSRKVRENAFM